MRIVAPAISILVSARPLKIPFCINGREDWLHRWKLPNQTFLQDLTRHCFKKRFMQERGSTQATKRAENCWRRTNGDARAPRSITTIDRFRWC
jgi:hypothetical protein